MAFKIFDTDRSGTIDASEFMNLLTRKSSFGDGLSEEDAQEIIDDFDTDGDGVLDFDEFCTAVKSMGLLDDADSDDDDSD